jgi:hypothetical protein
VIKNANAIMTMNIGKIARKPNIGFPGVVVTSASTG